MRQLNANWLTEGLIDFEYKKYILLAYLQGVKTEFEERKLYPLFSDLVFHYQNLLQIRDNKKLLYENFPEEISRADFKKLELSYRKIVQDDETMQEIEDLVHYAIPHFKKVLGNGKEIYEYIESNLEIFPVGITPIYYDEGYLFLNEYLMVDTRIYQYQITIFESAHEKFRGVNTQYIATMRKGVGETYESIKRRLVHQHKVLPNPATFMIAARVPCPLEESLLPVAKRTLVKYVSSLVA